MSGRPTTREQTQAIKGIYETFINPIPREKIGKINIDDDNYCFQKNKYYKKYLEDVKKPKKLVKNVVLADGKVQNTYDNNVLEVVFPNGAKRQTFPNGYSVVVFINGDIKQTLPDGSTSYFYAEHATTQFSFPKSKTEQLEAG